MPAAKYAVQWKGTPAPAGGGNLKAIYLSAKSAAP